MKTLQQFKSGQKFVAENGAEFDGIETFVLEGIMGFCGCGRPDLANEIIFKALLHIEDLEKIRDANFNRPGADPKWKEDLDGWNARGLEIFGNLGTETIVYYVLDKAGLIEHGGSVPGWLSELGEEVLKELRK